MAHFAIPSHVYVGRDALNEAAELIKGYGQKALVVTGPHVAKSPMMESLITLLETIECKYFVFDGINGEPTNTMIDAGVEAYKSNCCDFIIGIGGGSPLDSAKAIAVMALSDCNIADYMGKEIDLPVPPIVAIPTTSGTGSEATKFTVITDTQTDVKMLLKGDCLIPKLAILNYEFTMDMPKSVTAATGLDALTHAVEAYTSKKAMPLTDTFAISAVKRIMKYLPIAYTSGMNEEAKEQMSLAAFEAGVCINNSTVTIVHGMSRPIGALFHVPHGKSNAMLLTECLSFALDGAYDRFANLGRAIGAATEEDDDIVASEKFIKSLEEIVSICEIPTLSEAGIDKETFLSLVDKMSQDAVNSGSPGNTRKEVTVENCKEIYKRVIEK